MLFCQRQGWVLGIVKLDGQRPRHAAAPYMVRCIASAGTRALHRGMQSIEVVCKAGNRAVTDGCRVLGFLPEHWAKALATVGIASPLMRLCQYFDLRASKLGVLWAGEVGVLPAPCGSRCAELG